MKPHNILRLHFLVQIDLSFVILELFVNLNGILFAILINRVVDVTLTTFTEKSLSACYCFLASISHIELYELRFW